MEQIEFDFEPNKEERNIAENRLFYKYSIDEIKASIHKDNNAKTVTAQALYINFEDRLLELAQHGKPHIALEAMKLLFSGKPVEYRKSTFEGDNKDIKQENDQEITQALMLKLENIK